MKYLIIGLHTIFLMSISFGQSISVSKDTLKYLFEYTPHKDYDSLYIYNNGDNVLSIDTMINFNPLYSYQIDIYYRDSLEIGHVGYYFGMPPDTNTFPMEIAPNDSAKFIFHYIPPITKRANTDKLEKDSLLVYNNSVNQPILKINILNDMPLDIDNDNTNPAGYQLQQNYPNPFNPTTSIKYSVPSTEGVTLVVYDILGRKVVTLINAIQQAGSYNVQLSKNKYELTSGVFFYRLQAGKFVATKKFMLLK